MARNDIINSNGTINYDRIVSTDSNGNIDNLEFAKIKKRIYNVKDYGAIGDGIANDNISIQSAIDAAYKSNGGIVMIPSGNFLITGLTMKPNVDIYGINPRTSNLVMKTDGVAISIINIPTNGMEFKNFSIQQLNETHTGIGFLEGSSIANYYGSNLLFENLYLYNLYIGIDGSGVSDGIAIFDSTLINVWVQACGYGFHLCGSGNTYIQCRGHNCVNAISFDYLNSETLDGGTFVGGIFNENDYAITFPSANGIRPTTFKGTWFEAETFGIINVPNVNTVVQGLQFDGCMFNTISGAESVFNVYNIKNNVNLTNCTIWEGSGSSVIISMPLSNGKLFITNCMVLHSNGTITQVGDLYESNGKFIGSGNGTLVRFTINHNLGNIPSTVFLTPYTPNASGTMFVDNCTTTSFDIVYNTAPPSGTNNLGVYWKAKV